MYKIYFKQAMMLLRQNKFSSIISIIGTALAIMMIMVIIVTYSVKNANISPEVNRDRTLYIRWLTMRTKDDSNWRNSLISYNHYKQYLSNLKNAEYSSAIRLKSVQFNANQSEVSTTDNRSEDLIVASNAVDINYWKLMQFNFIEGQAFNDADFQSGIKKAVINESTAKHFFVDAANALGKAISIDFESYTITGVVKDVSPTFTFAYAGVYIPYTSVDNYENNNYMVLVLAKSKKKFGAIEEEVRAVEAKYNITDSNWNISFQGPYDHEGQQMNIVSIPPDIKANRYKMIFVFVVLLIIPAISLSGISISKMKRRTEEIGIRKAFGAKKYIIIIQTLYENFITTLIGGAVGLIVSYAVVVWLKKWLIGIDNASDLPFDALVSIPVLVTVFTVCFILNLLSASIPAYKASRLKIVDSLNRNNP